MSHLYRIVKQVFTNFYYWVLDYVYVAQKWIGSLFDQTDPDHYRRKGAPSIILIPGIYENWHFMKPVIEILFANNYDVHVIDRLKYNRGTVEDMAAIVDAYITQHDIANVVLVTHSKGGLIGKYLLVTHNTNGYIKGLIALHAPFSGSRYAYLSPLKSLRSFTPHSKILTMLAKDTIANKNIISLYGIFDPHIPGGSSLDGARNIKLPTYGHFRTLNDPRVHATILQCIQSIAK